jgi:hypothetical protein
VRDERAGRRGRRGGGRVARERASGARSARSRGRALCGDAGALLLGRALGGARGGGGDLQPALPPRRHLSRRRRVGDRPHARRRTLRRGLGRRGRGRLRDVVPHLGRETRARGRGSRPRDDAGAGAAVRERAG